MFEARPTNRVVERLIQPRCRVSIDGAMSGPSLGASKVIVGNDHECRSHHQEQHQHADREQQCDALARG